MPPRPRPMRFVSKYGNAILFATVIAAKLAEQRGNTDSGSESASKTVMAIAKALQTPAQNAAAPTMASRAMKGPSTSFQASGVSSMSGGTTTTSLRKASGRHIPKTRPNRPPMIIVGATTPAGLGRHNAKIVTVHFVRKQQAIVMVGVSPGTTQSDRDSRFLSKSSESSRGCGLPLSNGRLAANTVLTTTTVAIWMRSRHVHHDLFISFVAPNALVTFAITATCWGVSSGSLVWPPNNAW
mmetsp:Transcript_38853/g.77060  ORF Transcript_38853/g.77060 Transcript_38853/m.77060 type:complete len:240 (-) Transcript_38853:1251-1970(-)